MPTSQTAAPQPTFQPKFALGRTVVTAGVHDLMTEGEVDPLPLLRRHVCGDWGDLCDEDKGLNERALTSGEARLMSSYEIRDDLKVWIITEWDRSVTTLLLPSEY